MTVPAARLPRHKKSTRKGKKQMLDELNEALKASQPLLYGENTELVVKYYNKRDAALQ